MRENPKFAKFMGQVGPVLMKVEELMQEVSGELNKPNTGTETVSTQGVVIELLVPPDKKGGKNQSTVGDALGPRRREPADDGAGDGGDGQLRRVGGHASSERSV